MCELKTELFISKIKMTYIVGSHYTRILKIKNKDLISLKININFLCHKQYYSFSKFNAECNCYSLKCVN